MAELCAYCNNAIRLCDQGILYRCCQTPECMMIELRRTRQESGHLRSSYESLKKTSLDQMTWDAMEEFSKPIIEPPQPSINTGLDELGNRKQQQTDGPRDEFLHYNF